MTEQEDSEEENLADKKNKGWWRLEKSQIGRSRFS